MILCLQIYGLSQRRVGVKYALQIYPAVIRLAFTACPKCTAHMHAYIQATQTRAHMPAHMSAHMHALCSLCTRTAQMHARVIVHELSLTSTHQ